jgi:hypothetical protein
MAFTSDELPPGVFAFLASHPGTYRLATKTISDIKTDVVSYAAKQEGYDGAIIKNVYDSGGNKYGSFTSTVYIAFEPTQIKSAHMNVGDFDPKKADIRRNPRRRR